MKSNGKVLSLWRTEDAPALTDPGMDKLARLLAAYAPHDGSFELRIPGLHASRLSRANTCSALKRQSPGSAPTIASP